MSRFSLILFLLVKTAFADVPEALQDLQTEFYLPYSVTEDVDFSITRPGGFGCYQWQVQLLAPMVFGFTCISIAICRTFFDIVFLVKN